MPLQPPPPPYNAYSLLEAPNSNFFVLVCFSYLDISEKVQQNRARNIKEVKALSNLANTRL